MPLIRSHSLPNINAFSCAVSPIDDNACMLPLEYRRPYPSKHGATVHGGSVFLMLMRQMEEDAEYEDSPAAWRVPAFAQDDGSMWDWSYGRADGDLAEVDADDIWDWSCGRLDDGEAEATEIAQRVVETMSQKMWTWKTPDVEPLSAAESKDAYLWDWSERSALDEKATVPLRGVTHRWYDSAEEWATFNKALLES
mmetsp:Transcript_19413/g.41806  ORF Transcript_19413/g.41806 Transcript_19413/m.41806 type:complete len:196 (-) Transcript_19413:389-976(-)